MMNSINKKREEILRLIAKVADGTTPDEGRKRAPSRLLKRRQSLANTKQRRELLERRLLDSQQMLELHQMLEQRVAAIEGLVAKGLEAPKQAGLLPEPKPEADTRLADSTISGMVIEGILADMLQMVSSNVMTGIFTVESNGAEIRLYFCEGEICHGDGLDLSGESAFFAAMAVEEGRYFFNETDDLPEQRTISSKTQFLILEALRQIDESKANL